VSARACAGPGCDEVLDGRPPSVRYCGPRCRKGAYRSRVQVERGDTPGSRRSRNRPDPEQAAADAEQFRRELEAEVERSLARDPERWHLAKMADPDQHRRRARRQPWRSTS
jgi:hypothetical protein